jgi:hypothetical protein
VSATGSNARKYLYTFALGVIGGGLLAAWATRAVPRMMSGVMQNMMAKMREEGCDPMEM